MKLGSGKSWLVFCGFMFGLLAMMYAMANEGRPYQPMCRGSKVPIACYVPRAFAEAGLICWILTMTVCACDFVSFVSKRLKHRESE